MSRFPEIRLRRLRRTPSLRKMLAQPFPGLDKFIYPMFVIPGSKKETPIDSMPGQFRYSTDRLCRALAPLVKDGLGGVLLFGTPDKKQKDKTGSYSYRPDGLIQQAIRTVKKEFPELTVFTDVCLCAYTTEGHCAPINKHGEADNDAALNLLAKMAVSHAFSGADGVAPSAMMDGQVAAIRDALDQNEYSDTILMSYSTKFASAMYGPFREAAGSAPAFGDRRSYQASYEDGRQALRESLLDEQEGADILMVKPALFYLDVIARLRERVELPLAAYNVSGEYSMLIASAERGWGDLKQMARESIAAMARAGVDIFISYWASRYKELFIDYKEQI